MKRWIRCCVSWMMIGAASLFCANSAKAGEDALGLYARGAVLMDGDSGRILYGKEAETELPMASTTKIMTCIVALEEAEPDTVCTVSGNACAQPQVKLGMKKEDTFYLKDLLYSLMLESHNDSAVCIAETVGGSVEGFAARMNQKAKEIGCQKTYYITPNGLDAEDADGVHHTTARELALVMRYCLTQSPKTEEFLEITRTPSYSFTNRTGDRSYSCVNHNALLTILPGAVSGKTGFTGKAGYCYVGAARKDKKLFIVALLACGWPNHKGYKWVDTKKLLRYGEENFELCAVTDYSAATPEISVRDGQEKTVATEILWEEGTAAQTVLVRRGEKLHAELSLKEELAAPVEKGQHVGSIRFVLDKEVYAEYPVAAAAPVGKRDFGYCLRQCLDLFYPGKKRGQGGFAQ